LPRFLVEVPHDSDRVECTRVVRVFLSTGSHFLMNAEWGCKDGVHSAIMIVEVDGKAEARAIVPPPFRDHARIVGLNRFTMEEMMSRSERAAAAGDPKEGPGG
jgi:hypothetical protein